MSDQLLQFYGTIHDILALFHAVIIQVNSIVRLYYKGGLSGVVVCGCDCGLPPQSITTPFFHIDTCLAQRETWSPATI